MGPHTPEAPRPEIDIWAEATEGHRLLRACRVEENDVETNLPTRAFGRTGMQITRTGFGAWAIGGNMWGPQDDAESVAAIRHAVESGVNWIDTAAVYGNGHSEEVIAEALSCYGPAERPFVFTKGGVIRDADGTNPRRQAGDIRRQCEASLKRLRVERIDLYQLHWPSEDVSLEESWGEMLRLRDDGLAAYVGLSNHWVDQLETAEAIGHVETLQPPFSMVKRTAGDTVLPWCADHGTGSSATARCKRGS
jgi:aryl-alcohol dehydrogenase-like predicted oxidoreductase